MHATTIPLQAGVVAYFAIQREIEQYIQQSLNDDLASISTVYGGGKRTFVQHPMCAS